MRRLKDLDVMEVSAVKAAANRKKFAILKNEQGASMATRPSGNDALAEKLLAAFASIPKDKIAAIEHITKTAKARVRKSEDGDVAEDAGDVPSGLTQDAQDALRSAFRMMAPYAEEITPGVMSEFCDALGVEADDDTVDADVDATLDQVAPDSDVAKADDSAEDDKKAEDAVPDADKDEAKKSAEDEVDEKAEDKDEVGKADDDAEDKEADTEEEEVTKTDGMPDFEGADDADNAAAMDAARKAFAEAMKARGKKEATQKASDGPGIKGETVEEEPLAKSAIEKSAMAGLSKEARAALEPIFKSHNERFAQMERANKELVQKSQALADEVSRREFITKAATHYGALGRPEEIGVAMMKLHKVDPKGLEAWETILKAANATAAAGGSEGLFAELGTSMGNNVPGGALAKIQAHVDSVVQKSSEPKTREQIEAAFYETPAGKALYAQSRREAQH